MIKKYSLVVLFFGIVLFSQAQINYGMGIKAGAGYVFSGSSADIKTTNTIDPHAGIFAMVKGLQFSVQGEALFNVKNFTILKNSIEGAADDQKKQLNYISVPILFGWTPLWTFGFVTIQTVPQYSVLLDDNTTVEGTKKVFTKNNFDWVVILRGNFGKFHVYGRYV